MMRNLMITLAYDGSEFHGWQFQPETRTVQGCLEQALRRVLRHQVVVIGCSRTDAGVHAAGYVANCYTTNPAPLRGLFHAIGARLPKDMSVLNLAQVPLTFHSTQSAVSKLYRYRIFNASARPCADLLQRFVYHCWQPLNVDAMRAAAEAWIGTHDFTGLASAGNVRDSNIRTILRIEICRIGREVVLDVEGTGFLYKQVRNMVGTLVEIGRGHWPVERAVEIMEGRDRRLGGPTAPARGLCLQWVRYDIPNLPPPSSELLARAERAEPPAGAERADVDGHARSTAPVPPDLNMEEEPAA